MKQIFEKRTSFGVVNQALIQFKSPHSEESIYKGIPMSLRGSPYVLSLCDSGFRIRYRGPRRSGMTGQLTCLKEHATSFAVYYPTEESLRERAKFRNKSIQGWEQSS